MNMFSMLWALFSLVFVILEIGHPSLLFFLSLSFGSLSAALAAWYHFEFVNQMAVFFIATILALWLLKKFLKRMHGFSHRTNVYALVGKQAQVSVAITPDVPGYVKVQGDVWLARSLHACLPLNSKAKIIEVRGAHVIVEPHN
ncbi:hypothetical protein BH09DEP1_BH09DEP1_2500 [soil metagenome]